MPMMKYMGTSTVSQNTKKSRKSSAMKTPSLALDFLLFFVFWETVLVPMYFIIGIWGGPRRGYAAIKFMIYTLIGSVLMFLGILTLYYQHYTQFQAYSFDIADLMRTQ